MGKRKSRIENEVDVELNLTKKAADGADGEPEIADDPVFDESAAPVETVLPELTVVIPLGEWTEVADINGGEVAGEVAGEVGVNVRVSVEHACNCVAHKAAAMEAEIAVGRIAEKHAHLGDVRESEVMGALMLIDESRDEWLSAIGAGAPRAGVLRKVVLATVGERLNDVRTALLDGERAVDRLREVAKHGRIKS